MTIPRDRECRNGADDVGAASSVKSRLDLIAMRVGN